MSLDLFHPPVQRWFKAVFDAPTSAQTQGWQAIAGHPCSWTGVASGNDVVNHSRTGALNRSRMLTSSRYRPPVMPPVLVAVAGTLAPAAGTRTESAQATVIRVGCVDARVSRRSTTCSSGTCTAIVVCPVAW